MEEMPLFVPVTLSVSASISCRTSSKSVNFFPLQCRNSACSAVENGKYELEKAEDDSALREVTAQQFVIHELNSALSKHSDSNLNTEDTAL